MWHKLKAGGVFWGERRGEDVERVFDWVPPVQPTEQEQQVAREQVAREEREALQRAQARIIQNRADEVERVRIARAARIAREVAGRAAFLEAEAEDRGEHERALQNIARAIQQEAADEAAFLEAEAEFLARRPNPAVPLTAQEVFADEIEAAEVEVPVLPPRVTAARRFGEHREAGRIPANAVFGGVHNRYCGHRGCERRGGERGVRFRGGLYRCEVHYQPA